MFPPEVSWSLAELGSLPGSIWALMMNSTSESSSQADNRDCHVLEHPLGDLPRCRGLGSLAVAVGIAGSGAAPPREPRPQPLRPGAELGVLFAAQTRAQRRVAASGRRCTGAVVRATAEPPG